VKKKNPEYCPNCNCRIDTPSHNFCPYCGQKYLDKITLTSLFYNAVNGFFSFDSKLNKTILPFLFKPGHVASKFIEGKRQTYLHPVQLYVFSSFIFLFLLTQVSNTWESFDMGRVTTDDGIVISPDSFFDEDTTETRDVVLMNMIDTIESITESNPNTTFAQVVDSLVNIGEIDSTTVNIQSLKNISKRQSDFMRKLDSLIEIGATNVEIGEELFDYDEAEKGRFGFFVTKIMHGTLNFYRENGEGVAKVWVSQLSVVCVLFVPLYALFLLVFHWRRNKSFPENLSHALFLFSFVFLFLALLLLLGLFTKWEWQYQLFFVIPPIYFLISFMAFYKQGFFKAIIKLTIISTIFGTMMLGFGIAISIFLTILQYS